MGLQNTMSASMRIRTILQVCLATAITFMPSLRASAQDAPGLRSPALSRLYIRVLAGEPNTEKDFLAGLVTPPGRAGGR